MKKMLQLLFKELNDLIENENQDRREGGQPFLKKGEIRILGQMSLLANEKVSAILTLAQTADLDAKLEIDYFIKVNLKKLLQNQGLIYDEDSPFIWIPPNSKFLELFEYKYLTIFLIDPESALLSKAIKAPAKNKILIAEAIASNEFPNLVDRILLAGGNLEDFI